jgi:hypothetical protein
MHRASLKFVWEGRICESLPRVGTYLRDVPPQPGTRRNARLSEPRVCEQATKQALLHCCELDTFAMMMIRERLREVLKRGRTRERND